MVFCVVDGCRMGDRETLLPAIPESLRGTVIMHVHDGPGGAHFGRNQTLKRVKDSYYWPRRRQTVINYCRNCVACSSTKGPRSRLHGPLQTYQVGAPWKGSLSTF